MSERLDDVTAAPDPVVLTSAARSDQSVPTDRRSAPIVERTTRFTVLLHLPRMVGYGIEPRVKNGPALAGYGAVTMKDALAAQMTTLP